MGNLLGEMMKVVEVNNAYKIQRKLVFWNRRFGIRQSTALNIVTTDTMKRISLLGAAVFLLSLNALSQGPRPKLVVFVSIDQMKAEYLERYKNEFTGGFKRMLSEGTLFTNADLNYAPSETGPGHATLGTGCYPWKSGILANEWIDHKTGKNFYCVEDSTAEKAELEGGGVSPKNLVVTGIGDWLKQSSPSSKVIAASMKDRAAILMGGQRPDYAFWYDRKSGHMVTSEHYTRKIPQWVKSFNGGNWIDQNVPAAWIKLRPEAVYAKYGPDELEGEMKWDGSTSFPHAFQPSIKREQIITSPYGDKLVLDFAREAVRAEQLGQRGVPDLLCISLSCTDYVGHAFGSNSHEIIDQILRLDLELGTFIDWLEKTVGRGSVVVALSADHAAMPLPEYTVTVERKFSRRISPKTFINPRIEELDRALQKEFKTTEHVIQSNAFLNYSAARKANVDSVALEQRIRNGVLAIDGFVDIYFRRELLDASTPDRAYLGTFRRGYFAGRGKDFVIRFCENCLVTSSPTGSSHGSPYSYDTHVPIVFWGKGVKHASLDRSVNTVDIAPTLARMLGAPFPVTIDGRPLIEIAK
jgi:predicted AlkP superfamily pyrophosphatase or phosphodiesterase